MDKDKKNILFSSIIFFIFIVLIVFLVIKYQKQTISPTTSPTSGITKEKMDEIVKRLFNFNQPPQNVDDMKKWHYFITLILSRFNPDPSSGIREIICSGSISIPSRGGYPIYYPACDSFSQAEIRAGKYTAIAVSLNDIFSQIEKDYQGKTYYFCSITTPSWTDPLKVSYRRSYSQEEGGIYFSLKEGDVSCSRITFDKDMFYSYIWLGTIPSETNKISLGTYLIDKNLAEDYILKRKQVPQDEKEFINILNNQKLIYQREISIYK